MTRTMTAHEATVKTATVDVKALTISGRQVTLSVFRQLKDERLVDDDTGSLRGVPWGVVNYFWGECAKASEHLHVVWQKGAELRRSCCWPHASTSSGWRSRNERVDRLFSAFVLARAADMGSEHGFDLEPGRVHYSNQASAWVVDRWLSTAVPADADGRELWRLLNWEQTKPRREERWDSDRQVYEPTESEAAYAQRADRAFREAGDRLRERVVPMIGSANSGVALEKVESEVANLAEFERAWGDLYGSLAALDHLFIAV